MVTVALTFPLTGAAPDGTTAAIRLHDASLIMVLVALITFVPDVVAEASSGAAIVSVAFSDVATGQPLVEETFRL